MTQPKTAVLVLGMHRSGTSAVARLLNLLGAKIGDDLMAADSVNEAGYWESKGLVKIHQEFLAAVGREWFHAQGLPSSWWLVGDDARYVDAVLALLERDFGDAKLFVVKDPRLCLLVPLWLKVLERFRSEPRFVLVVRNPLDVAASLAKAHALSPSRSHLLWLRHVLESERWSRGFPRAIISYERLIADWRSLVPAAFEALRVRWPHSADERADAIDSFLSPAHCHHATPPEEVEARPEVSDWVKATYGAVLGLIDGRTEESVATLDSVREQMEAADQVFSADLVDSHEHVQLSVELQRIKDQLGGSERELEASRQKLTTARQELKEARQQLGGTRAELEGLKTRLQGILASRSWWITAPLRRTTDLIRSIGREER